MKQWYSYTRLQGVVSQRPQYYDLPLFPYYDGAVAVQPESVRMLIELPNRVFVVVIRVVQLAVLHLKFSCPGLQDLHSAAIKRMMQSIVRII